MREDLQLNVALLRRRVPNLTQAAKAFGLRPATVSNLCSGKAPLARAEVRTLVALAMLGGCTLDELVLRGGGAGMMESGIKVLDLFAPLVRNGTMGIIARRDMGQLVIVQELFQRYRQREYATVFWTPGESTDGALDKEIQAVMEYAECTATTLDGIHQLVMTQCRDRDILMAADRRTVLSGGLWALREKLAESGTPPITTILVDTSGEAVDDDAPYGPLDTAIRLDMNLVSRQIFPAVDPVLSMSSLQEGSQLELTHVAVQQRGRKLLRRYRELRALVSAWGLERLSPTDQITYQRGERLEAFLSQPFYVAEQWTKIAGVSVALEDTITGVRKILDGYTDDWPVEKLRYIGRLEP